MTNADKTVTFYATVSVIKQHTYYTRNGNSTIKKNMTYQEEEEDVF